MRKKMANLKIDDLHTTDAEIYKLSNMSSIKIHNLNINTSKMSQLNNDELENIAGGSGERKISHFAPMDTIERR
jgi:bacteriocin-like protein